MSTAAPTVSPTEAMPGLKGKNVLVTGGSSGIGQAIAVRFAQFGAYVAINYLREPDEAADTEDRVHACTAQVAQMGIRDVLVQGDVSKEQDVVAMVEAAVDGLGGLDVLGNNAAARGQAARASGDADPRHARDDGRDALTGVTHR